MAVETCWQPVAEHLKFAVIPNTLEVAELWVSAALAAGCMLTILLYLGMIQIGPKFGLKL